MNKCINKTLLLALVALFVFVGVFIVQANDAYAAVSVSFDKPSPQGPGHPIEVIGSGSQGEYQIGYISNNYFYQWQDWSADNTYTWTPTTTGNYNVTVRGKKWDSELDTYVTVSVSETYVITTDVWDLDVSFDKQSPQGPGDPIEITATSTGIPDPLYKFGYVYNNYFYQWQDWSTDNTYTWTPTTEINLQIKTLVKDENAVPSIYEEDPYEITTDVWDLDVQFDKQSPQGPGDPIEITATSTGISYPLYRFGYVYNNYFYQWQDWSTDNTYTWTPTTEVNLEIRTFVKHRDAVPSIYEGDPYEITTDVWDLDVQFDKQSPQGPGDPREITATSAGISYPLYKFGYVYNNYFYQWQDWSTDNTYTWTPTTEVNLEIRTFVKHRDAVPSIYERDPYEITTDVWDLDVQFDRPSPQIPGYPIEITATSAGISYPLYRFGYISNNYFYKWQDWSTDNTYTWTPTTEVNRQIRTFVKHRDAGPSIYEEDFYEINTDSIRIDSLQVQPGGSQMAGTEREITAEGNGAPAEYLEYRFSIKHEDATSWTTLQGFSTDNTCTWTPTSPVGQYEIKAELDYTGASGVEDETTISCTVKAPTVKVKTDRPSPQLPGFAIEITADSDDAISPEYDFWIEYNTGGYNQVQDFSTDNTFTWTPSQTGTYNIKARVRDTASGLVTQDVIEDYQISDDALRVSVETDRPSPQLPGYAIDVTVKGEGVPYDLMIYILKIKEVEATQWTYLLYNTTQNSIEWEPVVEGDYQIYGKMTYVGGGDAFADDIIDYTISVDALKADLKTDRPSPQLPGYPIEISVDATGAPLEDLTYDIMVKEESAQNWTYLLDNSTQSAVDWEPTAGEYLLKGSANLTGTSYSAETDIVEYSITLGAISVNLSADPESPAALDYPIELSADGQGSPNLEYRFICTIAAGGSNPGAFWYLQDFSTDNTCTWNPTVDKYNLSVVARDATYTDCQDSDEMPYEIIEHLTVRLEVDDRIFSAGEEIYLVAVPEGASEETLEELNLTYTFSVLDPEGFTTVLDGNDRYSGFIAEVAGEYTITVELYISGEYEAEDTKVIFVEWGLEDLGLTPDDLWADPVDASTGGDYINRTVFEVMGIKPLTYDITYKSTDIEKAQESSLIDEFSQAGNNTMGNGWNHNYETWVTENNTTDGSITLYWSPYNYTVFYPINETEYQPKGADTKNYLLKKNVDSTFELTHKDKSKDYFNSSGQLTKKEDKYGNSLEITRVSGDLIVTEPVSGQTLTISYNAQGLVESVSDKTDREITFSYDANGNLTGMTYPNNKTTTYTCDTDGHILSMTHDGDTYFTNTYDSMGRVLTQYDGKNQLTTFSYTTEPGLYITNITERNGTTRKYYYTHYGNLVKLVDELGHEVSFTYDENGYRDSMTDGEGNTVYYTNDSKGNILTITDQEDSVTTMTYDSNGNILTVTTTGDTENTNGEDVINTYYSNNLLYTSTDANGNTTTYTYNDDGQVLTKTVPSRGAITYTYYTTGSSIGLLYTESDYLGNTYTYEYDSLGRITDVVDREDVRIEMTYDDVGNLLTKTGDRNGDVSYTYDSNGNLLTKTDGNGNVTSYLHDDVGNLVKTTDAAINIIQYQYDAEDRLTKTTDAEGNETFYNYDYAGRLTSIVDAADNTTSFEYDDNGLLISNTLPRGAETTYTYYKNGRLKTVTDEVYNSTTTYGYDDAWRVDEITNAEGKPTSFTYDSEGNLLTKTDPLNHTVTYTYNADGSVATVTDARNNTVSFGYNSNGMLTSVTDALDNETQYEYDKEDRVVKIIDAKDYFKEFDYDDYGRVISITDEVYNTWTFEYDAVGNLVKEKDPYGKVIRQTTYSAVNLPIYEKDALGNITEYDYDGMGNLIEVIDALNKTKTITYDEMGRSVSVEDPLSGVSSQTFDADGNLKTLTDPNNNTTTFTYDLLGRVISETTPIGSTMTYGYNSLDLLTSIENARGQDFTLAYDDAGRITTVSAIEGTTTYTYDNNGNVLTVADANGTITRVFDALDRVTSYTDTNNNVITYTYDEVGNLETMTYPGNKTVTYEYYPTNLLKKVTDWENRETSYEYDKNYRLTKTTRANGTEMTMTYDDAGRVTQIKDVDASQNVINQYDYTYNAVGRITGEQSTNEPTVITAMQSAAMTYGTGNKLSTYNSQALSYDADGNMTYGPLSGQMSSFTYDSRNRLITAGGISYTYDAEDNRIAVTDDVYNTTEYVINPHAPFSQVLIKESPDPSLPINSYTYYIYGNGLIGEAIQGEEPGQETYKTYHFDLRGSTTAITNSSGAITDTFEYGPYGELLNSTGTTDTPFLYNGRDGVMTDDNGLYYMRARYYNPDIKRFINQDIVMGNIVDGRSINRYAYVNGNPVSYIDPFGLSAKQAAGLSSGPSKTGAPSGVGGNSCTEYRGSSYPEVASSEAKQTSSGTVLDSQFKGPASQRRLDFVGSIADTVHYRKTSYHNLNTDSYKGVNIFDKKGSPEKLDRLSKRGDTLFKGQAYEVSYWEIVIGTPGGQAVGLTAEFRIGDYIRKIVDSSIGRTMSETQTVETCPAKACLGLKLKSMLAPDTDVNFSSVNKFFVSGGNFGGSFGKDGAGKKHKFAKFIKPYEMSPSIYIKKGDDLLRNRIGE